LLGFWFFGIALVATLLGVRQMSFNLIWYSMIFPNVGFTIAVIYIGIELSNPGTRWVSSIMTIFLTAAWLFVISLHFRAVITKRIMMPGMDEDKGEWTPWTHMMARKPVLTNP
jgi:tellurite resistance protein TehA-like permease